MWPRSRATRAASRPAGLGADDHDFAGRVGAAGDDVWHGPLTRSGGVLHTQDVLAEILAVDAIVCSDATSDTQVFLAVADLGQHVWVGDVGPGHAHHVNPTLRQYALGLSGIANALGMHDRHFRYRLDAGGEVHEWLRRQCHGGHAIGQGVMGVGA